MAIPIVCPQCGAKDRVPDTAVGKRKRCKVCGTPIKVEEVPESPQKAALRKKANKKARAKDKQRAHAQQNLQTVLLFLGGVVLLAGVGLAAFLVPSIREVLAQVLVIAGAGAAIVGYGFIFFTEEEPIIRVLMRFFPPVLFYSVLKRTEEAWPYLVLVLAGLASLGAGLAMQKLQ
ncbi:MAG: hypothetical protein KDA66_01525 [Planctomycetaceae bacterium]|nr:hypothetical protein [Planctomycetaceae bacterium]